MYEDEINKTFESLIQYIDRQKMEITLSKSDSRVLRTDDWILNILNQNCSCGNDKVASSSLSIIGLKEISSLKGNWRYNDEIRKAIECGGDFLVSKYEENQWEKAIWDTAVAVRALIGILPEKHQHLIKHCVNWLIQQEELPSNYGPHHLAQRLITLISAGVHKDIIKQSLKKLSEQIRNEKFNYSPYVLSQCLEALSLADPKNDNILIIGNILVDYLLDIKLDSANFINICLSLHGLWIAPIQKNHKQLRISTSSLFGDTCFRDNGSWYRSEIHTAWAIVTLTRYSKEIVINAPYSEIHYEIWNKQNNIIGIIRRWTRREFRNFAFNILIAVSWGILLGFFITYTTLEPTIFHWLTWAVGIIISSLVAFSIREIIKRSRYHSERKKTNSGS